MGGKSPSWGDQWVNPVSDDDENDESKLVNAGKKERSSGKKIKAVASAGLDKAKTAAAVSAHKVKTGTSVGFKWVKNKYLNNNSSST